MSEDKTKIKFLLKIITLNATLIGLIFGLLTFLGFSDTVSEVFFSASVVLLCCSCCLMTRSGAVVYGILDGNKSIDISQEIRWSYFMCAFSSAFLLGTLFYNFF